MICRQCGFNEDKDCLREFIGIFAKGVSFSTTNDEDCGIFGCPKCGVIQFTTDVEYIRKRKERYKNKVKDNLSLD